MHVHKLFGEDVIFQRVYLPAVAREKRKHARLIEKKEKCDGENTAGGGSAPACKERKGKISWKVLILQTAFQPMMVAIGVDTVESVSFQIETPVCDGADPRTT